MDKKVALVTGASSGIGTATVSSLADAGYAVMAAGRNAARTEALRSQRPDVRTWVGDIRSAEACRKLVSACIEQFGRLDLLVNNAGMSPLYPSLTSVTRELWDKVLGVNLAGPFRLSAVVGERMAAAEGGAIINVASLAGRTPVPGAATYSASKFGLRAFTFALAEELADSGIKIAAVSPGPIDTGFIMSNIDDVTDVTFSQPMSTAEQVARPKPAPDVYQLALRQLGRDAHECVVVEDSLAGVSAAVAAGEAEAVVHVYLAQVNYQLEDYSGALKALDRAGGAVERVPSIYHMRAQCHWLLDDRVMALATLDQAMQAFPDEPGFLRRNEVQIASEYGGRITQVLVGPGTRVRVDAHLVSLDATVLQDKLAEARAAGDAYRRAFPGTSYWVRTGENLRRVLKGATPR